MLRPQTSISAHDAQLLSCPLFHAPLLRATRIWCQSFRDSDKDQKHRGSALTARSAVHYGRSAPPHQSQRNHPVIMQSSPSRTQSVEEASTIGHGDSSSTGMSSNSSSSDPSNDNQRISGRNSSYSINGSLDADADISAGYQQRAGRSRPTASQVTSQGNNAQSAQAMHGLAKSMQRSGKLKDALALASKGLARFPSNQALRSLTASLESKLGNYARAAQLCAEGLQQEPDNVHLLTTAATAEGRAGHTQVSRGLFQKADRLNPGNAVLLQSWGVMESSAGGYPVACRLFAAAAKADPDMVYTYTAWGRCEMSCGNMDQARHIFREGLSADPTHAPLLHAWAELELQQEHLTTAKKLLRQALRLRPRHVPSYMALGRAEWMSGQYGVAREVFEEGHAVAGPSAPLLHVWAQLEMGMGSSAHIKAARELFDRISILDPSHVPSLQGSAQMEDRAGNATRSTQGYQAALAQDPSNVQVLHGMAQAHLRQGNAEAAEQCLMRVQLIQPGNGHLCHTRGVQAQKGGDLAAAAAWFERGKDDTAVGGSLLCYEGLAELHAFARDTEKARATFEEGATRCRRPTSRYLRQWAVFERKANNVGAAASLFGAAVRSNPQDYKAWLGFAVFERWRGNSEVSERCFQSGLGIAPANPHIWYLYATMVWKLGRVDEARELFTKAIELCPRSGPLWMEWAAMEWGEGNVSAGRQLFERGSRVPAAYQHAPLYEAWARLELAAGNVLEAGKLTARQTSVMLQVGANPRVNGSGNLRVNASSDQRTNGSGARSADGPPARLADGGGAGKMRKAVASAGQTGSADSLGNSGGGNKARQSYAEGAVVERGGARQAPAGSETRTTAAGGGGVDAGSGEDLFPRRVVVKVMSEYAREMQMRSRAATAARRAQDAASEGGPS